MSYTTTYQQASYGQEKGKSSLNLKLPSKKDGAMFVEKNKLNMIFYVSCFAATLFVYHVLSDGDFSFLLTLGSLITTFGFTILFGKLSRSKSFDGVSLKSLQLYALVFACRLSSILVYEGYLPYDSTGDWLIKATELTSLGLCLAAIFTIISNRKPEAVSDDRFGDFGFLPGTLGSLYLIVPCLVAAFLYHPNINKNIFTDIAWTFATYLEVFAILPQFYMLQKLNKAVEASISHFCFSIGFARVFLMLFWFESYQELGSGMNGLMIIVVQFVHLAIMGEFCLYYLLAAKQRKPLILPSSMGAMV